jgi:uncharacterized protein YbaA (DUF1428 family)
MYVVGFVTPVPKKNLKKYLALARKAGKVWMKHGALSVVEAVGDDVKPGKLTSFPQSVKLKKDEVVVFSFVTYTSRKHRDAVDKRVFADPFMKNYDPATMPFDGKRMMWGGFKSIVVM